MKNLIKNVSHHLILLVLFAVFAGCQKQAAKDIGGGGWPPRPFSIGGGQWPPRNPAIGRHPMPGKMLLLNSCDVAVPLEIKVLPDGK